MGSLEKRVAEATGGAERGEEEPERAEPRPGGAGSQSGVERPWWKRVFRG